MADPATAFEAFKACLDQIPASGNRAYAFMKDFQPLIAAALAFVAGVAAWYKLREDRKAAELVDREKKKALYWRTHTEASICRSYSAGALKKEIDEWIKDNPAAEAIDYNVQWKWKLDCERLAATEYDEAYEQLSVFPLDAFSSIRMLNGHNKNLRIFASDKTFTKSTAEYLSKHLLPDMTKYASELCQALDPFVINFTIQERELARKEARKFKVVTPG